VEIRQRKACKQRIGGDAFSKCPERSAGAEEQVVGACHQGEAGVCGNVLLATEKIENVIGQVDGDGRAHGTCIGSAERSRVINGVVIGLNWNAGSASNLDGAVSIVCGKTSEGWPGSGVQQDVVIESNFTE